MSAPELKIIDADFNFYGTISGYTSLQWNRRLYEIGDVELHLAYQNSYASQLQEGRIMFIDEEYAAIIQTVEETQDKSGLNLVVKGKELKGIVADRVSVPGQREETSYFGYDRFPDSDQPDAAAETVIKHYIDNHMVNPADANRRIPRLIIAPDAERGVLMRWSSRFEGLDAVLKGIGEWASIGYVIKIDLDNERFVFDVIEGADRTINSDSPIIFSVDFSNLSNFKHSVNVKNYRNAGYAGGAGEDEERLIQTVFEKDTAPAGFARKEIWLDCGSIGDIDDLLYEAKYKLQSKKRTDTLTGNTVDSAGLFVYRKNWDLGDKVTIRNRVLGLEQDEMITAIKEVFERGRHDITATFGNRQKDIVDEVRKTEVVR